MSQALESPLEQDEQGLDSITDNLGKSAITTNTSNIVKQSNTLTNVNNIDKRVLCDAIASGQCTTLDDLVMMFNITFEQASLIMSDPTVLNSLVTYTKAKANLTFHTEAVSTVQEVLRSGDNKEKLSAVKILGEITKNLNAGMNINVNQVNVSLESKIRYQDEKQKENDPNYKLDKLKKEIQDLGVIEADFEEVNNEN